MVSIDFPIEVLGLIGIIIIAMIAGIFYFGMYWMDMRSKNPELHVFNRARNKPHPDVVALVDLSGRHLFFNAEKDKPQDVKLKKDDYGLLLDSRLASKRPRSVLQDGISILYYGTNFHFPLDPNGARAITQLIRKIRKEYKQLNFIRDDIVLLELLTKAGEDIHHDAKEVLEMYPLEATDPYWYAEAQDRTGIGGMIDSVTDFGQDAIDKLTRILPKKHTAGTAEIIEEPQQPLTTEELVSTVEAIKGKLKDWRVEPGWFSMKDGLALLPIGTTSTDMKRVETITKINTQNEMGKPLEWWKELMPAAFYAAAILVVSYMVITAMKPG